MAYRAKKDIEMLSTGQRWVKGQSVGDDEIPQPLRSKLIAEGCLELLRNRTVAQPQPAQQRKRRVADDET